MKAHRENERERRLAEDSAAAERVDADYVIYHVGTDDVSPEMLAVRARRHHNLGRREVRHRSDFT
jgi:hypothetical protein